MRKSKAFLVGIVLVLTLISAVCRNRRGGESIDSAKSRKISVRLGWLVNANSAGQIVALEKGFFKAEGLDVKLNEGGLDSPSVNSVAAGSDQIGFANGPDLVINARAAGAPLKIIAVIQQRSYHGFMVRRGSKIFRPKDWEGKRVGVKYASPTYLLYQMLIAKEKVDRTKITEIPLKYDLQAFLENKIDVYPGAFSNEELSFERMGLDILRIDPVEYGIQTYGNVVFTTDAMIAAEPETLRRFLRATIRGWEWCLKPENWNETVDLLLKRTDGLDRDKELASLKMNVDYVRPSVAPVPIIGWVNQVKLQEIIDNLKKYGVLKSDIKAEEVATGHLLAIPKK